MIELKSIQIKMVIYQKLSLKKIDKIKKFISEKKKTYKIYIYYFLKKKQKKHLILGK